MDYIENFENYLLTEKGRSKHTISGYKQDLIGFIKFLGGKPLEDVKIADIRAYIAYQITELDKKRTSVNRCICALRVFFDFLVDVEGVISKSPATNIKTGSIPKTLPKGLTQEEMALMLKTAREKDLKTRLLIELLYGLGGRVTEIASLKLSNFDFDNKCVYISGKGNKERVSPIHDSCLELVKLYTKAWKIAENGFIFPSNRKEGSHLTREAIYHNVKELAKKAGISRSVSPHVLRHSFATHLLDKGCDIATVQDFLGHENISTTRIYARVTTSNKVNKFNQFHPLAQ